jgi:hypothetical protein
MSRIIKKLSEDTPQKCILGFTIVGVASLLFSLFDLPQNDIILLTIIGVGCGIIVFICTAWMDILDKLDKMKGVGE